MAQYCIYAGKETNCTDNCKICLKEEIDGMKLAGYPEEEIKNSNRSGRTREPSTLSKSNKLKRC